MVEYAYTTVPGKLKQLLGKIRAAGIPQKVTVAWLKTVGFKSSNDHTLAGVLKFIGFIDGSNIPTPVWNAYRGADHRAVLGQAIRTGYADLFAVYPDANIRPQTDVQHVFSTSSSAGQQVISKTVATFKALVDEADFSDATGPAGVNTGNVLHAPAAGAAPVTPRPPQISDSPEVHIDIQIHISPESTPEQIDKIFESMARHLYGRKGDG